MKVLWFNHRAPDHPRAGGAEKTLHHLAQGLQAKGHTVVLGCPSSPHWTEGLTDATYRTVGLGTNLGAHLRVPETIRTERPDVIVDDLAHVVPWASPWFSRVSGVAFFRHLHRRTLQGQVGGPARLVLQGLERLYPTVYRTWTFATESRTGVEDLVALGIDRARTRRIPPGVDLELFRPFRKSDEPTIIYFGGVKEYKRPGHALVAFSEFLKRRPGARLLVVGEGPSDGPLAQLARALGTAESIDFLGRLDEARLANILASCWASLHCATSEGWSLTALEAAAAGVPTIAYEVPGIQDSVSDGLSGILVRGENPRDLAEALVHVMDAPSRWQSSSRGWGEGFSWERSIGRWESLLVQAAFGSEADVAAIPTGGRQS